jgi:hypothetical protein
MAGRKTGTLGEAFVGIAAVIASFLTMYAVGVRLHTGPTAAIMSAVLALTLARRPRTAHASPWLTAATLPLVAVASAFVGHLLVSVPVLGALLFIAALFVSVWLRQFGARAAALGTVIAQPFHGILIVPIRPNAPGGPWVNLALVVCAGLVALGWIAVVRFLASRGGWQATKAAQGRGPEPRPSKAGGPSVTTRMAVQMAVALGAAFAIGLLFFRDHWGWIVITAFIVCSGARGRGDAAYKGLMRLGGALAGTVGAALIQIAAIPSGTATAVAIFAALFVAMALRERNYAYWAGCITLVLALLQRTEGAPALSLLVVRLEGIFIGALCGVLATWFVYPIRTESVVRRRVAEVLAALDDLFHEGHWSANERSAKLAVVEHRVAEMDRAAPPVELHLRVFARGAEEHPASWIAVVRELVAHARIRVRAGAHDDHESTRRAIRHSRRSVGRRLTPEELAAAGNAPVTASLRRLRETLAVEAERESS